MQTSSPTVRSEPLTSSRTSNCERCCPLCGGPVVDVRSMRRCVRCSFTLCEGCDGAGEAPYGEGD